MSNELQKTALDWATGVQPSRLGTYSYCETRDIFQACLYSELAEIFDNIKLLNTENSSVQATLRTLREYSGLNV